MGQEAGGGRGAGGPLGGNAAGPASVDRFEVEQLGAVGGQVQVKALVLQVVPGAFVAFRTQQVFHRPVVRRQVLKGERCVTLARVRREVHGHQVELDRKSTRLNSSHL